MQDPAKGPLKRLNLITSELDAVYHQATLKLGLTDSAMKILYTMYMFGGSCQLSEIVRLSGLSKQTVNSSLRRLEDSGTVYLESGGGRRKRVCLTEDGRVLAEKTVLRLMNIENQVLSAWSSEDQETYIMLLQRFLTSMRDKVNEL